MSLIHSIHEKTEDLDETTLAYPSTPLVDGKNPKSGRGDHHPIHARGGRSLVEKQNGGFLCEKHALLVWNDGNEIPVDMFSSDFDFEETVRKLAFTHLVSSKFAMLKDWMPSSPEGSWQLGYRFEVRLGFGKATTNTCDTKQRLDWMCVLCTTHLPCLSMSCELGFERSRKVGKLKHSDFREGLSFGKTNLT